VIPCNGRTAASKWRQSAIKDLPTMRALRGGERSR
jgi:hypothetical protein